MWPLFQKLAHKMSMGSHAAARHRIGMLHPMGHLWKWKPIPNDVHDSHDCWKLKQSLQGDDMGSATQWKLLSLPLPLSLLSEDCLPFTLAGKDGHVSFNMLVFSWCKRKRKKKRNTGWKSLSLKPKMLWNPSFFSIYNSELRFGGFN